jgi:hypothetical protein
LDDLLELINSLVNEKAEIYITQKFTREAEAEWLHKVLLRLKKDEQFFLVAEVDKKVVASSDFQVQGGTDELIGAIGIVVRNGYRNLGIGTEIMKTHLEQAASFGSRALTVNVFATNKRAIHVYEKIGFVQTDIVPKKHFRQGSFIDEIIMAKLIG